MPGGWNEADFAHFRDRVTFGPKPTLQRTAGSSQRIIELIKDSVVSKEESLPDKYRSHNDWRIRIFLYQSQLPARYTVGI